MERLILLILSILIISNVVLAQNTTVQMKGKLYSPSANAKVDIANALKKAESEGKHVLIQIGGNWCGWCILLDRKLNSNDTLKSALMNNFIVYHLNYSSENYNADILASLGFPQRFGFPVLVVLDSKGNRLHTQNTSYLEEGKGHHTKKVLAFLNNWSPSALDKHQY